MSGIILFMVIFALVFFQKNIKYKKSTYYKRTHYSYIKVLTTKKIFSTYRLYCYLQHYEFLGMKFLFHCTIPKDEGESMEVDLLMISESGIFVFDMKRYGGLVQGDEHNIYWIHQIHNFIWRKQEFTFVNPVLKMKSQNKWILKTLVKSVPIYHMIIFPKHTTFADIELSISNVKIISLDQTASSVQALVHQQKQLLTEDEVQLLYESLSQYAYNGVECNMIFNLPIIQNKQNNIIPFHALKQK